MNQETPAPIQVLIDLPNLNATVRHILPHGWTGRCCNFGSLATFIAGLSTERDRSSATLFLNVRGANPKDAAKITCFREQGYAVYAKPKMGLSDIDDNIVEYVGSLDQTVKHLFLATHDRRLLTRCLKAKPVSTELTVVGLAEYSSWALRQGLNFIDLGDIPDILPREARRRTPTPIISNHNSRNTQRLAQGGDIGNSQSELSIPSTQDYPRHTDAA